MTLSSFSVAKATRKCHAHIQPTELKLRGEREEDHICIHRISCVCPNLTSPPVKELRPSTLVFNVNCGHLQGEKRSVKLKICFSSPNVSKSYNTVEGLF